MATSDAYGRRFGDRLRAESAPAIVARSLRKAQIAVTEIRADNPTPGMSGSLQREDAYLVGLQLRDYCNHQYWEEGRQTPISNLRAGETCLYDLKRDPVFLVDKPFHSVHFYLTRAALNAIADDANAPRISELDYRPGVGMGDSTIFHLGTSLLSAFGLPEQANQLFIDHVTLAVGVHVAQTYGGMRSVSRPAQGGLAPWQVRRAKEILTANLDGSVSLKEVATECRLSVSHFSRAFRRTMGVAPHSWLLSLRVDAAKAKLSGREMPLSEVAQACGFADQAHFTRIFTRMVGISPGAWRRALEE